MKIVIAQHKGGVGKTTLAVHIAGILSEDGLSKILLMDCDSQADSFFFYTQRKPNDDMELVTGTNNVDVLWNQHRIKLSKKDRYAEYDHIVVDIDTRVQNALQVITETAPDLILLPIDKQYLSLTHLADVLSLLATSEGIINYPATIKVVQMGSEHDLTHFLSTLTLVPNNLSHEDKLPYLPDEFNQSLRDCCFVWLNSQSDYIRNLLEGIIQND